MTLATKAMAHRYLYYVKSAPIISDYAYDQLEAEALKEVDSAHPLNSPGSDRAADYSDEIVAAAECLRQH